MCMQFGNEDADARCWSTPIALPNRISPSRIDAAMPLPRGANWERIHLSGQAGRDDAIGGY